MATYPAVAQEQMQSLKAAAQVELTASASTSEAGDPVTFTVAVTGAAGVPTGTVTFKDGESILGSVALSAGHARLTTSTLPVGRRTITATYSGDATFDGSVSAALTSAVLKAATTVQLTASGATGEAGHAATFTAAVTGAGGIPTGTVIFKDGESILGRAAVSEGHARFTTSTLAAGRHDLAAIYGGDARFRESTSEPQTYLVQPAPVPAANERAVLVLLTAVIAAVLLVLLRRIAFRWVLRPVGRGLRALFRSIRGLLRLGGGSSVKQRPVKSFLGLSVGAIAEAFTETDDAIAVNFDKSSVRIDPYSRLVCSWIRPVLHHDAEYNREDADEDFVKAKQLFGAEVPLDSNPLNLYDDIHNAFIVRLLSESDKACFYILSEFRRVINSNVSVLAGVFSFIVSFVAVINISASTSIDFYHRLSLDSLEAIPPNLTVLGIGLDIPVEFNKAIFGLASCALGFGLMWMFYHLAYDQSQRYNGQQMNNFLVSYLANISIRFNKIHASATQAVIGDTEVHEMKRETVLWITNLHWIALRVLFIEEFLRNILFQIRRNSIYSLFLVPLFFIGLMLATMQLFGFQQLSIMDLDSNIYRQNSFYLMFPLLLYGYYRYLIRSLTPMSDSIEGQWSKFRELNVVEAMTRIMESYAVQLDQWRSRFKQGPSSTM